MSAQRARASSHGPRPHSLSLKVLRLSLPTLATQTPLPKMDFGHGLDINTKASLAHPSGDVVSSATLTPALTLPSSFGLAYVGERFACTLCVNNELEAGSDKRVDAIKVTAELQTPSEPKGKSLELKTLSSNDEGRFDLDYGRTLQFSLQHNLKEAGPHVLAVTITYTETVHHVQDGTSGGRVRTFRKLYQFVAQPLISVRSKVTERKNGQQDGNRQWTIEAQLENVGEHNIVLGDVVLKERDGVAAVERHIDETDDAILLKPQDIQQVMFFVKELTQSTVIGKRQLGQIVVNWNSPMGESGRLTTGWLTSKT